MGFNVNKVLENIQVIGVSYTKTAVNVRELFSISSENQVALLKDAKSLSLEGVVILSTCNRTEIYAQTQNTDLVKQLFVKYSKGSLALLEEEGYYFNGEKAVKHLYNVGVGLDSQILGDYQIIGQLKSAYRLSEKYQMVNTLLNRIFSHVFQASKKIKNQTELSNGVASVAHAAVQYIKNSITNLETTNFLLYGTGEIGKITCDNLVRHLTKKHTLTLINRTKDKAELLAKKYQVSYKTIDNLSEEIEKADVIIVATDAGKPTVTKEHFAKRTQRKLILDLSVPRNVAEEIADMEGIQLINVDILSGLNNETLEARKESIPLAESIVKENYKELQDWLETQHLSPIFKSVKKGLERLKEEELSYHRTKLTDEEYEKIDFIATNIINRIARMGILHIKDVFKSNESSAEILSKMFNQYAKQQKTPPIGHPHKAKHPHK